MLKFALALAATTALLTAPAAQARPKLTGEQKLAQILDGREAGDPVDCISLNRARSTKIVDGTAIVYDAGSTLYVNRPVNADRLDRDDILVTRTFSDRLCSVDTVQLHDRTGNYWRGFVALDKFVPYRKVASAN